MSSLYLTGGTNFWVIFLVVILRYFVLASLAYLVFYTLLKKNPRFKKIQSAFPTRSDYLREILYSLLTAAIFAVIGFIVFVTPLSLYTQAYWDIGKYGLPYFFFSIMLMIVVHDAYFYWTHRLMHTRVIYRLVHRVHHLSTNPSPWAALSFHPFESIIEGSVIAFIAFLFPVHPLAIGIFLLFMMAYNVYGHLGFELYPKGFARTTFGKWINTSVNHNQHHLTFQGNYGLYFLWWDRWMGTIHPNYDKLFEAIKSGENDQTAANDSTLPNIGSVKPSKFFL